jgi:undecaprenyl-diphosphatase
MAMNFITDMILGALQGLTEFLPVSSSGHLAAAQLAMQRRDVPVPFDADSLMLEILLHLATLMAVILFYRRECRSALGSVPAAVISAATGSLRHAVRNNEDVRRVVCIVVATVPTAIIGLLFKDLTLVVGQNSNLLGGSFFLCAAMLISTRFISVEERTLSPATALLIGIAQGIAVFPGISRSGMTIACALALGIPREEAVRFSFLLSIPAILGAALLEIDLAVLREETAIASVLAGAAVAFVTGLAALFFLVRIVRSGRLWLFAPYVGLAGVACIAFL